MWIAYYVALPSMPLSVAATALYASPLFIAVLASLLTDEPVRPLGWLGIVLGFVGVIVILRPGSEDFSVWTLLPVLAASFYAFAAILTRTRCPSENALVLALALHLSLLATGILGTAAVALFHPSSTDGFLLGGWTPMGVQDWLLMAGLGLVMAAVAGGVAKAYQSGPPATVGAFDYAYLVFSVLWGVLIFRETLDGWAVVGVLLIITAGMLVLHSSGPRSVLSR